MTRTVQRSPIPILLVAMAPFLVGATCDPDAPGPISIEPGDRTPPTIRIETVPQATYTDDGSPAPAPVDTDRRIAVAVDDAMSFRARADDPQSAIESITVTLDLGFTCRGTFDGAPESWGTTGVITNQYTSRAGEEAIPFWVLGTRLTPASIYGSVCSGGHPDHPGVTNWANKTIGSNPIGTYHVRACNHSTATGTEKCADISGHLALHGLTGRSVGP